MKNKKVIDSLTAIAKEAFEYSPKETHPTWESFSRNVRDVVCENLEKDSYDAKSSWDYDPTSRHFFFSLHRTLIKGSRRGNTLTSTFHVDGALDLGEEITRLHKEIAAWDGALWAIRKAQLAKILEEDGLDAFDEAAKL